MAYLSYAAFLFLTPVTPLEADTAHADSSIVRTMVELQPSGLHLAWKREPMTHFAAGLFVRVPMRKAAGAEVRKSPAGAFLRSLGSTVIPAGIGTYLLHRDGTPVRWIGGLAVAGGGLVGPSAGHFYAHNEGQAWNGIAVRGGAGVVGALAAWGMAHAIVEVACPDSEACDRRSDPMLGGILIGVLLGAAAMVLFRTVYDLATTWRATQRYNTTHGFSVRPRLNPAGGQAGLALSWTL